MATEQTLEVPPVDNQDVVSNRSFFNSSKRSDNIDDSRREDYGGYHFNEEIESGFKSAIYLKMETMIENIKKYRNDFKGTRIRKFEEKYINERIIITNQE